MNKEILEKVINQWDPIRLLEIGCPQDEYDIEIRQLENRIKDFNHIKTNAKIIHNVFVEYFGIQVFKKGIEECETVAQRLMEG